MSHCDCSRFQSAYRCGHSVEATIPHVSSSILKNIDEGQHSMLSAKRHIYVNSTVGSGLSVHCCDHILWIKHHVLKFIQVCQTPRLMFLAFRRDVFSALSCSTVWCPICPISCRIKVLSTAFMQWHPAMDGFPLRGESNDRDKITRCFKVVRDCVWKNCLKLNSNK